MGPGSRRDEILGNSVWEAQNPHLEEEGERELGWDLGAEGTKSSEIQLGRPFWFKMALPAQTLDRNTLLELFSAPVSKHEKCLFAPGSRLYNTRLFLKDSHQKSIFSET